MVNAELFGEVLAGERNRPRRRVNTDFLGRFVKRLDELFVLRVGKVGWSTGSWFVVDNLLERLIGEPFEPIKPL